MREILFRGQTRRHGEKVNMRGDKLPGRWVYGGGLQGQGIIRSFTAVRILTI